MSNVEAGLPPEVEALLEAALVAELTVVSSSGEPVTYPLIPLYDGHRIYMTSAALFSRKLRHIKANPRVAVSLTDPVGVPSEPFHRATIQGTARVLDDDLHAGWERLLPLWRAKEPVIDTFVKKRFALPLFFERSVIEITPTRVMVWRDGRTDRPPSVADIRGGRLTMTTLHVGDAIERCRRYDHAVLSYLGPDGYPIAVAGGFRVDAAAATVDVGPLTADVLPVDGQRAEVTFSHVRPQPGVGYDERRYVNLWGRVEVANDGVRLSVSRASGWDEEETPFFEYAERNVGTARAYLGDVGARPRLSLWWTVFLATRLPFLTATIVPVALGGAVAAYDRAFAWGWFLLALAAAIAVHLGLNMANDLFDDASGADAANVTPTPFSGGSRVIQYGLVTRRTVLVASVALYAVAVAVGLILAATRSWWLLAVGAGGLALSLAYTAPPLKLVHRGLGEPVTALGFGPVMVMGTYLAVTGTWSWHAFYASLPVALLIALVLYVNQVPDRIGDTAAGKRTLVVRLTRDSIVHGYALVAASAFVLIAAGGASGYLPHWTLLALLPAPLVVRVWRGLRRWYDDPYALMPVMQLNIGLHLATGLLLVVGYLAAALAR